MTENVMTSVPTHIEVDTTPAIGEVLLIHITDDLESVVVRLTPANAYKLAQRLITAAESIELP